MVTYAVFVAMRLVLLSPKPFVTQPTVIKFMTLLELTVQFDVTSSIDCS